MMTENVLTLLPPRARKALYIIYGLAGLTGAFTLAFYAAAPDLLAPWWVTSGLAGLGALTPFFSTLAASNVKPPNLERPVEQPDLDPPGDPDLPWSGDPDRTI